MKNKMTKLDDDLYDSETRCPDLCPSSVIREAARSYAALQKLVEPDLVKLVEAKSWVETGPVNHRTEFTKAANEIARERIVRVLKAIYDNLTAFGKETSND